MEKKKQVLCGFVTKALPEVLQKVVEVKRLLEADKNLTDAGGGGSQVGLRPSQFLL